MNQVKSKQNNEDGFSVSDYYEALRALRKENEEAQRLIYRISGIREFKIAHLLLRLRYQLFRGSKIQKRDFFKWIFSLVDRKSKKEINLEYYPLYQLLPYFNEIRRQANKLAGLLNQLDQEVKENKYTEIKRGKISSCNFDFLREQYTHYDVIILGLIDFDFRYQRPQHIADAFAGRGHRVFYVNAFFSKTVEGSEEKRGKLHVITLPCIETDAITALDNASNTNEIFPELEKLIVNHGIRDAVLVVDYPGWVSAALDIRKKYGFPIVSDYMDDYTGFSEETSPFLKRCCKRLLEKSDAVITSSQFLEEKAKKLNDQVKLIRNGTEFEHFHQASAAEEKAKKTIGYFGAIAEWFDEEIVEYIARQFPEYEILLIGGVTNSKIRNWNYPNVKLLGEKPYSELPEYLKTMDVCLIPFRTSDDLIRATNPVKFYEYLSAGKKIVATEIPELLPFRNRFAYLENDREAFAARIRQCLEGTDTLASPEECFAFAKENDWKNRTTAFMQTVEGTFEKISIIILCYNQLEYTEKCINSILENTAYPNYEIILVDNASQDGTATYIRELAEKHANIVPVINKTNRGFAGGNNDGISLATGEYIVLLNNDTIVTRGWLTAMRKHLKNNESGGMVGAVTNSIGNDAKIEVNYDSIDSLQQFSYEYTAKNINCTYMHNGVLAMFCVMFHRSLVDVVGLLDENYGIGLFEDDDFSYAIRKAGYELILPADVFVHHFGSASFGKLEEKALISLFERNKKYYENKWGTTWKEHIDWSEK